MLASLCSCKELVLTYPLNYKNMTQKELNFLVNYIVIQSLTLLSLPFIDKMNCFTLKQL